MKNDKNKNGRGGKKVKGGFSSPKRPRGKNDQKVRGSKVSPALSNQSLNSLNLWLHEVRVELP